MCKFFCQLDPFEVSLPEKLSFKGVMTGIDYEGLANYAVKYFQANLNIFTEFPFDMDEKGVW